MLDYLMAWSFLPSREGKTLAAASGSEKRRWIERASVEVNGLKATRADLWPRATDRVVIHPNGKHRTTLQ